MSWTRVDLAEPAIIAVMWYGTPLVQAGELDVALLSTFFTYITQVLMSRDELDQGGLGGARGPDDAHGGAAGDVEVNVLEVPGGGRPVADYSLESLRDACAMVLQKNTLFSGTIRENLLWGDENASDQELEAACEAACAWEFWFWDR